MAHLDRFRREIEVSNELHAQGCAVVPIMDAYYGPGFNPYYVMPFYPTGDLRSLIRAGHFKRNLSKCLSCLDELYTKLRRVHLRAAHRDLKPENILVDQKGALVLCDFGLCLPLEDQNERFSETLEQLGSRHYIASEALAGYKNVEEPIALDVFAFGKIAFDVAAGVTLPGFEEPLGPYDLTLLLDASDATRVYNFMVRQLIDMDPRLRMAAWFDFPRFKEVITMLLAGEPVDHGPHRPFVTAMNDRERVWRREWSSRQPRPTVKGVLPQSQLIGTKIALPTPCGHHVYFPARLAQKATEQSRFHVFHTRCECGVAYLLACEPRDTRFRRGGPMMDIVDIYEALPWDELTLVDENGQFFYKEAPSYRELYEAIITASRDT